MVQIQKFTTNVSQSLKWVKSRTTTLKIKKNQQKNNNNGNKKKQQQQKMAIQKSKNSNNKNNYDNNNDNNSNKKINNNNNKDLLAGLSKSLDGAFSLQKPSPDPRHFDNVVNHPGGITAVDLLVSHRRLRTVDQKMQLVVQTTAFFA